MNDSIKMTIRDTIIQMLENSTCEENIRKMITKHMGKVHFVPIRYRIIGGILQGLNIKFGNFIEQLISNL